MREGKEVGRMQSRKGLRNTELRFCLQLMSVTGGAPAPGLLLKEEVLGHAGRWAGWRRRGGGWETVWHLLLCIFLYVCLFIFTISRGLVLFPIVGSQ